MTSMAGAPVTVVSGHAPRYLADDIDLVLNSGSRLLRSTYDRTCAVRRTYTGFSDRSLSVAGPRVWNALPASLRQGTILGGSVAEWLRRWTCNSQVASSIPGRGVVE